MALPVTADEGSGRGGRGGSGVTSAGAGAQELRAALLEQGADENIHTNTVQKFQCNIKIFQKFQIPNRDLT